MKVTISVPTDVFRAAERVANRAGMSRSEFYTAAIRLHLEAEDQRVTDRLNSVYQHVESSLDPVLEALQLTALDKCSSW